MTWIDFFADGERLFLDVLLLKREAEDDPHSAEFVTGLAYIGVIFDLIGNYKIASRYHLDAMRCAKEADHPLALAFCHQMRGVHDYHIGDWDAAVISFEQAASTYWVTGHIRYWGGATSCLCNVLISKGDTEWIAVGKELLRVAIETQDQQLHGWARLAAGITYAHHGAYEAAVVDLERAAILLELVPDYLILAWTLANLSSCHLKAGQLDRALGTIERSIKIIKDHGLMGSWITRPMMVMAEVYIFAAEQTSGEERKARLKVAAKACKVAAKQGKTVRDDGAPDSLRLCGIYAWITGDRKKAQRLWNQSIAVAETLGARYVLAQTNFEIGKRLNSRQHLILAEALFVETGAQADLSITQQHLRNFG